MPRRLRARPAHWAPPYQRPAAAAGRRSTAWLSATRPPPVRRRDRPGTTFDGSRRLGHRRRGHGDANRRCLLGRPSGGVGLTWPSRAASLSRCSAARSADRCGHANSATGAFARRALGAFTITDGLSFRSATDGHRRRRSPTVVGRSRRVLGSVHSLMVRPRDLAIALVDIAPGARSSVPDFTMLARLCRPRHHGHDR